MTISSDVGLSVPREVPASAPYAEGSPGFGEYALARTAMLDARALGASREGVGSALLLLRSAIILFARAHAHDGKAASGADAPAGGSSPLVALPVLASALQKLPAADRALAVEILGEQGEARLTYLSSPDPHRLLTILEQLAIAIGSPLDARAEVVRRAALRRWLLRSLVAGVLAATALWLGVTLIRAPNLALHQTVTLSSQDRKARARTRALVDGDHKNLGCHTQKGQNEWAMIDLGAVESIEKVKVYNRYDCCKDRALPLRLDVSSDGTSFTTLARRTEPFSLWTIDLPPTQARFVRLTNESVSYLHLSEVEVY